jgi:hypothetical protein
MRVFISYSLSEMDSHIATLLARQAQTQGLIVDSSQYARDWTTPLDQSLTQALSTADVVVGIVSNDSSFVSNTLRELQTAVSQGKPVIALVEQGTSAFIPTAGLTYVEFNRYDPGPALNSIGRILEDHRNKQNAGNWIVAGGLALLALYLLSGEEK